MIDDSTLLATGTGQASMRISSAFNGMNLTMPAIQIAVKSSSGVVTVDLYRGRQATPTSDFTYVKITSTAITIDAGDYDSSTAVTAAVVDTNNDDLVTGDRIRVDVIGAGTGVYGLIVTFIAVTP